MDPFLIIVFAALAFGAYFMYAGTSVKGLEGHSAEKLYEVIPELKQHDPALVYCYTENCGPCKRMIPEIAAMQEAGLPVFKLDVRQHFKASKQCGIRATPTILCTDPPGNGCAAGDLSRGAATTGKRR
ncbi:MAG: thioredoxin family protein [bacterium]